MKGSLLRALVLGAVLWPAGMYAQTAGRGPVDRDHGGYADTMAKVVKADDMKWEPLGGGFDISILYTNPTTQATYLVIRGSANQHVPRHWHSSNETITALQGTFVVASIGGICLHAREDGSRGVDR
jgi:hypothetical protein